MTVTNITIKSINPSDSVTSVYIKFCPDPRITDIGNLLWSVSLVKVADIPVADNSIADNSIANKTGQNSTTANSTDPPMSNTTTPTDQNSNTNSDDTTGSNTTVPTD